MLINRKESSTKHYPEIPSVIAKSLIAKYQKNKKCKAVSHLVLPVCGDKGKQIKLVEGGIRIPAIFGKAVIPVLWIILMLSPQIGRCCAIGYDCGVASWYGRESARHHMANGKRFDRHKLTAAGYAYPLGTVVEITNLDNGKRAEVIITDRGPARRLGRLIDLSEAAATRLGFHSGGLADVSIFVKHYTEAANVVP